MTGKQLPYGKKQLMALSLVDYAYIGEDRTIINQIKFRTNTCQRKSEKQSQWCREEPAVQLRLWGFLLVKGEWESVTQCCQKGRILSEKGLWPPPI